MQKTSCVAVIAAIMVFTLLDLRVDGNLPLMRVCKRVTQGIAKIISSRGLIQFSCLRISSIPD